MKGQKLLSRMAVSLFATGLAIAGVSLSALAEQLRNNQLVQGVIDNNSSIYRFTDTWTPGSPRTELHGQEYSFTALEGDQVQINLDNSRSYGLSPVLVLFNADNNKQVAFSQSPVFSYQIQRSGNYRLVVLAKDASAPKVYALTINGLSDDGSRRSGRRNDRYDQQQNDRYDRQGRDRYDRQQNDRYDRQQNDRYDRQQNDRYDRQQMLQNDFGLQPADCNERQALVRVTFRDKRQDSIYCARPNRYISAGDYFYNPNTQDLEGMGNMRNSDTSSPFYKFY